MKKNSNSDGNHNPLKVNRLVVLCCNIEVYNTILNKATFYIQGFLN
jgi:hypothetical protein